jgi:hypothetical protein
MAFDSRSLLPVSLWPEIFVELNQCSVMNLTLEGGYFPGIRVFGNYLTSYFGKGDICKKIRY